jgi:DNA polymerase III epsilon subunit-like protein
MALKNDPKTKTISLKEFFESNDYLCDVRPNQLWTDSTAPDIDRVYYLISGEKFARICYSCMSTNFGMDLKEKLESIEVAYRDGVTEYCLFEEKIGLLRKQAMIHKRSALIPQKIRKLQKIEKHLPPFAKKEAKKVQPFSAYLHQTGYRAADQESARKYVVFDVETNGLRKKHDDLLSLSIYDPVTGLCYNRFFPLDVQPVVLTTQINGITGAEIKDATHLTQPEVDEIIDYFHLKERTLLSFSGGKGLFDSEFVENYCQRHSLRGFENLTYRNIKSLLPAAPFGFQGSMNKDDLCSILGISGVQAVHSGENDCVLEWKLFEKIGPVPLLCIQERLYRYDASYIVPITYLPRHPELVKLAQIYLPPVRAKLEPVFHYDFPKSVLKCIRKFSTNITGIAIENAIDAALKVDCQDNYDFLLENRRHLKFVGSLMVHFTEIPILTEDDGTLKAVEPKDEGFISDVNRVTAVVVPCLASTIDYIQQHIFPNEKILSQEMVISDDKKVLALCDLSSKSTVMEIKTFDVVKEESDQGLFANAALTNQLYYQKKGRNEYVLSLAFDTNFNMRTYETAVRGVVVTIYHVDFVQMDASQSFVVLPFSAAFVLRALRGKPSQTLKELVKTTGRSPHSIRNGINVLKETGYIERVGTKQNGYWKVLKDDKGLPISADSPKESGKDGGDK